MARKVDWSQIPWEDVNDQVSRKVIMGDRVMMVMYRFQAGLTQGESRGAFRRKLFYARPG
jgi:hypothetical protein